MIASPLQGPSPARAPARAPVLSPVLSPDALRVLALDALGLSAADTMSVRIMHAAMGTARLVQSREPIVESGDVLTLDLQTQFGRRVTAYLNTNQLDTGSLRQAVQYLDRIAREQPGDPTPLGMPIPPRTYPANTTWHETTVAAYEETAAMAIPTLVQPLLDAKQDVAAFAGVFLRSQVIASKDGLLATGQESDTEVTVTGWSSEPANGMPGAGWAGQAARDWRTLDVTAVGKEALRLTQLAAHPVAVEPGRRTAILGRPAVAQLIRTIGYAFDAQATFMGQTPMYNHATHKPKLGERVTDTRLSLTSNPNDPDGGVLPFNGQAYPIIARTWITNGVLQNLAFSVDFAAAVGVTPASDSPDSLRLMGTPTPGATTVEEMIVHCKNGIYVNRISHVEVLDTRSGMLTGVTSGGCFLVRDGKIEKSIKNLRILVSPWFFMNQVEAIGTSERTAFGYAPWAGSWPIAPTIVPPLMVRDFNFSALADSV